MNRAKSIQTSNPNLCLPPMEKVLVTGASGLIGRRLVPKLLGAGFEVNVIGRSISKYRGSRAFVWNPVLGTMDVDALKGVGQIVHLAGANVGEGRWTEARKAEMVHSRVSPIQMMLNAVSCSGTNIRSFIGASGINYYGTETSHRIFTEADPAGSGFLSELCVQWEAASDQFAATGARVVKFRTGVVLDSRNGALPKMASTVRLGMGAALGSGQQWMPWIHIDDVCDAYLHALQNTDLYGAYNLCAPQHITNAQFTKALAHQLKRPLILPNVPKPALRLALGEMAEIILEGSRVDVSKLTSTGFQFNHADLTDTLHHLLGKEKAL